MIQIYAINIKQVVNYFLIISIISEAFILNYVLALVAYMDYMLTIPRPNY